MGTSGCFGCSGDREEAMEGMMGRVEQVSLLKNDGPPRAFQLAHAQTQRPRLVVLSKRIPCADYDGRSSNGSYRAQTGWGGRLTDSGALQCAALRENGPFVQQRRRLRDGAPAPAGKPKDRMIAGRCKWGGGD